MQAFQTDELFQEAQASSAFISSSSERFSVSQRQK